MKKLLIILASFLLLGVGSANAVPFYWDLSNTNFTATGTAVSGGGTIISFPNDITTGDGTSFINQTLTGGADDTILDNGDTFTEYGGLVVLSAGTGLPFPNSSLSFTLQYDDGVTSALGTSYITFEGLSGYVYDHNDGGTPTTNAATIQNDSYKLAFTPGAGTIKFYLDTDYDPTTAGSLEIASLSLIYGEGTSPQMIAGTPEGQFGIIAGFQTALSDFWYLDGSDTEFNAWMTEYGIPSIFASSFNLGATAASVTDNQDGSIDLVVANEGSFIISAVPEPATMMLLGFGLLGLAGISRRKKA